MGPDTADGLRADILRHLVSSLGSDPAYTGARNIYRALALAVRDRLAARWLESQRTYYTQRAKRVYYLSLEYLPGRFLLSNLFNLGLYDAAEEAVASLGASLAEIEEMEWDAGLGNGGLGRLASCYLDSLATLDIPGYGYGIRYDYGIFYQVVENGRQVERSDNWMRFGNVWELTRELHLYEVRFGGRVETWTDERGRLRNRWTGTENIMAMACDIMVPGYGTDHVINMRLWSARSSREFDLTHFNMGEYVAAVHDKVLSENISKVLYPSEEVAQGRELRLRQQYFFVSATLQDILRRTRKEASSFAELPDLVAIQLNDTHPTVAITELMRILVDEEELDWDAAWDICTRTFAYTNHTVLPEALEVWPEELFARVLPRHLQIIFEINRRHLDRVAERFPGDGERRARMSIIREAPVRGVRMANLAIVGSRRVNGVSALHSDILKERLFRDFHELDGDKFTNVTNGITPRRWLLQANRPLSRLVDEAMGPAWVRDLGRLIEIAPLAGDAAFRDKWQAARRANKARLAAYALRKVGLVLDEDALFDVHVKRIHEYKRQLLNLLHTAALYLRIKNGRAPAAPRVKIFAGKAAPGYRMAKEIILLVNHLAETVNNDPATRGLLQVCFLPNYCISSAEKIIPAADLSEQISTAGLEASGTGNMKFSLNGAIIIGTLDGANIEMRDAVGDKNIFIFGLTAEEVAGQLARGYNPWDRYAADEELRGALDAIRDGAFSPGDRDLFRPLAEGLLRHDPYLVLADYRAYAARQERAEAVFLDREDWTRRSIANTASMGFFSSDRAVLQYARDIWRVEPVHILNGK
ncbi:MAG: glycogen/starch/alpha-glucan phosphorylase [Desulfovibrionaceae bacterium]|nr:glycogen/starch/alpha-glucan phosphorylase [Desulfovibrionaceae bacterium]